ncbi:2'-5' RNA ligase family protein [Hymenobacter daeguensis]
MPFTEAAPLILTLALDEATQTYFNGLRQQHFPPKINYLAAHLTLFHHLPGHELAGISATLQKLTAARPPLMLQVTGLRSLGRGVAFALENAELRALHRQLQAAFAPHLTPQDQQKLQPHVTIQNKVDPATAHQLLADMQAGFAPFEAVGTGLHLWEYRGGPWASVAEFGFENLPRSA